METVCDSDGFVANVWRSIQFSRNETARWCDWPVNHVDLEARRNELIKNEEYLLSNLISHPEWHDIKLAGYWIWAASCWIGRGLTLASRKSCKIPYISDGGVGVHSLGQLPHISNAGMGVHALGLRHGSNENIYQWFSQLSDRLRYVRVVCGDWERVCGGQWQDKIGQVGIFFDPPYGVEDRKKELYHHDSTSVAADVMEWAMERGNRKTYKIVIAGYEEYLPLLDRGWTKKSWIANGGYANQREGEPNENRKRETLYFSPHCLKVNLNNEQEGLF